MSGRSKGTSLMMEDRSLLERVEQLTAAPKDCYCGKWQLPTPQFFLSTLQGCLESRKKKVQ